MKPDDYQIEGVLNRKPRGRSGLVAILLLLVLLLAGLMLTPLPEKIRQALGLAKEEVVEKKEDPEVVVRTVEKEVIKEVEVEPELIGDRERTHRLQDGTDLLDLSNGIKFYPELILEDGGLASAERKKPESYEARYTLKVKLPKAAKTMEDLAETNGNLAKMLPGLPALMESAKVSPFYERLYGNKARRLKNSLYELDDLLSRHNFFDCETMLELRAAESGRKVFLLQGDMDVVSDGSDGDRLATMPDEVVSSTYYQPFTSYGWKKETDTPNPMLAGWKERIGNAKRELAAADTTAARKKWLRERMKMLRRGITDMERRSFLIAEYDPFIVIPVNLLLDRKSAYVPNVGDYAVVIYQNQLYPAIVGDGGPSFKVGEASLRMARKLDENAGPYRRPVSSLGVTYLVFPRSAPKERAAPDYALWKKECERLLDEIGGLGEGYELFEWKNLLKKPEPPEEEKKGADEKTEAVAPDSTE